MRRDLPHGTVTFLFTDVEGSTRLLHELGAEAYADALAEHRALIRQACAKEGGVEVDTQGDAFFFAFSSAPQAVAAASAFTEALAPGPIQVRVGLHTGTPLLTSEGYVGDDVHRAARIAAAGHGGQVLVSSSTAALTHGAGLVDLGDHRFKDLGAPERVYQHGAGSFPPLRSLYRTNLPIPATPFLGRERELAEVVGLLEGTTRLLTLTGPGGTGKTRLALQAAGEASDSFPDGVYWLALAPLRDAALVVPSVAQALHVREQPGTTVEESLASFLDGKRILLLLDNAEHLLEAASGIAFLLARSSSLTLLVTSRETLRLQAEHEYSVPTLASEEAVALFCERARVEPSDVIRELCARLDNLPLALELAAARLKLLTPEQLLARLGSRLDLLKGGRDADPRQQTLRATIEWSYDLLSTEEQQLFARLSVFAGGCTLEAAEDVCAADLDTLESLLDKSLLRRRLDGHEPRFWMLETIREYAAGTLERSGESDVWRARHAAYFLALAEELEPAQMGGSEEDFARLRPETDNLRAALELFSAKPDPSEELRLAGSLFRFWPTVSLVSEGSRVADHALARSERAEPSLRMKCLYAASLCAFYRGDLTIAAQYEEERLEIARAIRDRRSEAVALNDLAIVAMEGRDVGTAADLLERSAALVTQVGDQQLLVPISNNLGELALQRGEYARAREILEGLLASEHLVGGWATAHVLESLGYALLAEGERDLAATRFSEGLALVAVNPMIGSYCLDGLAAVAVSRDDMTRAARLAGAAEAMRERSGFILGSLERDVADRTARTCRETMGDEAWKAEVAAGAAMPLEEAIAYALEVGDAA